MIAMEFDHTGAPLECVTRAVRTPKRGHILILVGACGICRTDLHVIDGDLAEPKPHIIPGHEIIGRVVAIGPGVRTFKIGGRVGVPWLGASCGRCHYCRVGRENLCDHPGFTGYTIDGGYAQFATADAEYAFAIPPEYSDAEAAPLMCAGLIGNRPNADEIEVRLTSESVTTDEEIAQRSAHVLEWYTQIPTDEVKAEVRNGMVALSGDVDWNFQRTYTHRQVEGIEGVVSVTNNIHVRKRPAAQDVRKRIEHALHRHANIEASKVSLSVQDGTVTLRGDVDSFAEKDRIVDAAWSAAGVSRVIDNLRIAG